MSQQVEAVLGKNARTTIVWLVCRNVVVAAAVGSVVVTIPLLDLILVPGWFIALLWSASYRPANLAVAAVLTQIAVMAIVVVGATIAPVKTTDRFLDHTITVPETEMTLAEIGGDPNEPQPNWLPYSVRLSVPSDEKTKQIAFPATAMTLREFVNAVESQSSLRHRFGHCGNGSTILWGGDCSFGLHLRRPTD